MSLSDEQLESLRQRLQRMQTELREQVLLSAGAKDPVMLDQTLLGRVSRVDAMQQQSMARSTRDKAERRLAKVNRALGDLEKGEYGYCRQCDEVIAFARLEAQPEAALCFACQSRADQL